MLGIIMSHDNIPFFYFHCGEGDHSIAWPEALLKTISRVNQLAGLLNIAEALQVGTHQTPI